MNLKLFFCLLVLSASSFAQGYFLNNPVWMIASSTTFGMGPNCVQNDTYNYYLKGDSVIGSHTYRKLFKKGQITYTSYSLPVPPSCQGMTNYYDTLDPVALVRDTLKKIFICDPPGHAEVLPYDFNLVVGDTLPLTFNNSWHNSVVTSIDSILIRNSYRKRFQVNASPGVLIEEIGSVNGFLENYTGVSSDGSWRLSCYSQNDTAWYPSKGPSCVIPLGIAAQELTQPLIDLFPNPADQQIRISCLYKMSNLMLYNAQGKCFLPIKETGNVILLNTSSLVDGLYLLMGTTPKGYFSRKLLIRHP